MSTPAPTDNPYAGNGNGHPDPGPGQSTDANGHSNSSRALAAAGPKSPLKDFINGLDTRIDRLKTYLPEDVDLRRFIDTATAAVAGNPFLLKCDQRSLYNAIIKAARDRLLPDGREGALVAHNTSTKVGDRWVKVWTVRWNPMVFGIRKRFMEAGQLILEAQCVHVNDAFHYELGDAPFIHHSPPDLRKRQPRGELCGAYAILRRAYDGSIVHREVMTAEEIDRIRKMVESQMKEGKSSPLWSKHTAEAWKKTVVHRLAKTVPLCAELADIFARDTEDIDWGADVEAAALPAPTNPDPLRDPDIDLSDDIDDVQALDPVPAPAETQEAAHVPA